MAAGSSPSSHGNGARRPLPLAELTDNEESARRFKRGNKALDTDRASSIPLHLLHAMLHGVTAAVFAYPLALTETLVASFAGSFVGALLPLWTTRRGLKLSFVVSVSIVGTLLTTGVASLLSGSAFVAEALGPQTALRLFDVCTFFGVAFFASHGLRCLSLTRRGWIALELVVAAFAFGQLVVAHRRGAINRPFELTDAVIAAGEDPSWLFYAVGAAACVVLVLGLLRESGVRVLLHLAALSLLLLLFFASGASQSIKSPAPPSGGAGLGLNGEDEQESNESDSGGGGQPPPPELEFRDENTEQQSQTPQAVVIFHTDYSPDSGVYYFRQAAFSEYNGQRLVASTSLAVDGDLAREYPFSPYDIAGAPSMNMRTRVEQTVALLNDHPQPFALEAPLSIGRATNPDPDRFVQTYSTVSAAFSGDLRQLLGVRAGDPSWPAETLEHYTEAPTDSRYAELAVRILDDSLPPEMRQDALAMSAAITGWLGEEGTYNLRSNHASADDPTAHFLFGDLTGYCVHFAHAAVFLMRSVGIPSRVATGYAVEESTRRGGSALLVTADRGHAWPEIYLEGVGWIVMDVFPQTNMSGTPSPPDEDLQRLLGELARGLEPVPPDPESPVRQAIDWSRWILRVSGYALFIGALLLAAFVLLFKVWRRIAPRFVEESALPKAAYRAALDMLSDAGFRRDRGQSREAFASELSVRFPSLGLLTKENLAASFGGTPSTDRAVYLDALSKLRRELRSETKLFRRFVGLLTPWTWIQSR